VRPPTTSSDDLDEQLLAAALHSQKEELDDDDCWDEDVYNFLQDHLSALGVSQQQLS